MPNWVKAAGCKPVTSETLEVRVLPCPLNTHWEVTQSGRVRALGARSRRFKSCLPNQNMVL